jgi:hypothetical protein
VAVDVLQAYDDMYTIRKLDLGVDETAASTSDILETSA